MPSSIRNITNALVTIETENKLFDWSINGIIIWEIIRYQIYFKIVLKDEIKSIVDPSFFKKSATLLSKLRNKILQFIHAIIYNPFFDNSKIDVLVFESSRKIFYKEVYIDPSTEFIQVDLRKEGKKISVLQSSYVFDRLAPTNFQTKHLDALKFMSALLSRFVWVKLSSEDQKKIRELDKILEKEFKIPFDI
jgi:hypothetical protein